MDSPTLHIEKVEKKEQILSFKVSQRKEVIMIRVEINK